jgi:hypothetical protein
MANVLSPFGLRPVNLIGGQPYAGAIREFRVASNNAAAIFNGDLVQLSSAGLPSAVTSTPVAVKIPSTSADATAGIVGVCVGARYVNGGTKQPLWNQFLPANTITNGGSDVWVQVVDDPDALFRIQAVNALGTFNSGTNGSGWPGAIGKNANLGFATAGSTTTGNSGVNLIIGTNGASLAATATLPIRIIDIVKGTESDTYPEFIVKFNVGVHSYQNSLGV